MHAIVLCYRKVMGASMALPQPPKKQRSLDPKIKERVGELHHRALQYTEF